jgi:hypothetical protein
MKGEMKHKMGSKNIEERERAFARSHVKNPSKCQFRRVEE